MSQRQTQSTIDKLTDLVKGVRQLAFGAVVMFSIMIIGVGVFTWQVHERNQDVSDIRAYVDELQAPPTLEEQEQNEAINNAIQIVPRIRDILCEAFPEVTACQEDTP